MSFPDSVAQTEALFTPKQAARVKYRALLFRLAGPEGARQLSRLTSEDPRHRWFMFCLDAVARRESLWTATRGCTPRRAGSRT